MERSEKYQGFSVTVKVEAREGARTHTEYTIIPETDEARATFKRGGIVGWQTRTTRDLDPARHGDVEAEALEFTMSIAKLDVDWFVQRYPKDDAG